MNMKKCIVYGCTNHHHQGTFVGDLCAPCYNALSTGKLGRNTNSFLSEIYEKLENAQCADVTCRPDWDELFMRGVYWILSKSKDTKTKIGAVLVNDENHILGVGYNNPARGINDDISERYERPEKYFWMSHAERNAISNCSYNGIKTKDAILYTNGLPCSDCADAVINSGIKTIYTHRQWEDVWKNINYDKWKESAKRSFTKFEESGVNVREVNKKLNIKTLISGETYVV